ncbi:MAG: glycosyltransferase [Bacteroidales bacterium]|nr:glycosyltransferase [Bacteroidales bacterium]
MTSIQLFYYFFFYIRFIIKPKNEHQEHFQEPISVIIAAHNESENLQAYLPLILRQKYSKFEVIVINDRSEDDTEDVLEALKKQHSHLRTTFIKNTGKIDHGKKLAITLGIKAAQYDYVLLTDADCYPKTDYWIETMAQGFTKADIVLGYGPYSPEKSFLNRWIRFDTLNIAMQYISMAKTGLTYMGVGRNLAYKKSLFIENKGLASHAHLPSGDDDLFINEISKNHQASVVLDEASFMYSKPESTFKFWFRQKERHLSTFNLYRSRHQALLFCEIWSREMFWVLFLFLIPLYYNNLIFIGLAGFKLVSQILIMLLSAKKVNEKDLWYLANVLDFLTPILNFFLYLDYLKTQNRKW